MCQISCRRGWDCVKKLFLSRDAEMQSNHGPRSHPSCSALLARVVLLSSWVEESPFKKQLVQASSSSPHHSAKCWQQPDIVFQEHPALPLALSELPQPPFPDWVYVKISLKLSDWLVCLLVAADFNLATVSLHKRVRPKPWLMVMQLSIYWTSRMQCRLKTAEGDNLQWRGGGAVDRLSLTSTKMGEIRWTPIICRC